MIWEKTRPLCLWCLSFVDDDRDVFHLCILYILNIYSHSKRERGREREVLWATSWYFNKCIVFLSVCNGMAAFYFLCFYLYALHYLRWCDYCMRCCKYWLVRHLIEIPALNMCDLCVSVCVCVLSSDRFIYWAQLAIRMLFLYCFIRSGTCC